MINVYIDGSSKGNPGLGGAGVVIQNDDGQTISMHGIPLGYVTNNQAEFLALKHALTQLKERPLSGSPINILTDSTLVVGIFSQNWKARANLDLVVEIKAILREFPQVTFTYVRGHNGNQGNELADSLAQEAAESQKETENSSA
ncbi:MAG: ribonuclease HI [Candidatus Binatia bacterium]